MLTAALTRCLAGALLAAPPGVSASRAAVSDAPQTPPAPTWSAVAAAGETPLDVALARMEVIHTRLGNGLEVILVPDRSAPLVAVDVWYHVGSGDEEPGKSGFAHLFEHMMFQGAKHIGEDAHFETLKRIGGTGINGTTNSDRTNYFEVVPAHELETALWLESDRMGYLLDLLTEKSLANQRDVVRNERRQRYDNVAYAVERFAISAALYPEGHPYRYMTIGQHEDLERASLEDVRAFFRKWYVPSNATIALVGDFDPEKAKALVEKWFGSFPKLPVPAATIVEMPRFTKTERMDVQDPLARLVRMHWAFHAPKSRATGSDELQMLGVVLSADGWGRLEKRLVLQEKLARSARAYYQGGMLSGSFHIVVDLVPGADAKRAETIVGEEIAAAMATPPTETELLRVIKANDRGLINDLESHLGRAERLQYFAHYAKDPLQIRKESARLRAITPAQVNAAAKQWLGLHHVLVVTNPGGRR